MSTRRTNQLFISTSTPVGVGLGDEWLDPTTGILNKQLFINNQVSWQQLVLSPSVGVSTITSQLYVSNTTLSPSFSTNSGALVVAGGVGIGGNLNVGGTGTTIASITTVTNTTPAVSNGTGAFQVRGGAGISGALYAGGVIATSSAISAGTSLTAGTTVNDSLGNVRTIPITTVGNYTLVAADNGKMVSSIGTITVPANVLTAGQNVMIYNSTTAAISITTATGLTMWLAGTNTEGARTLAARGVANIVCITTQTFVAWCTGLT